jgi:hypothetical protein
MTTQIRETAVFELLLDTYREKKLCCVYATLISQCTLEVLLKVFLSNFLFVLFVDAIRSGFFFYFKCLLLGCKLP